MHRIDGPGATADNRFTDGDPVGGVQATMVTDDWANAIQEEIISVISDPAVVPAIPLNKAVNNQLITALKRLFGQGQATESVLGTARVATQVQANAGTDDATFVTPKKLRNGFASSFTTNGYVALPSWLGGLIFQWGSVSGASGGTASATFSVGFNTVLQGFAFYVYGSDPGSITTQGGGGMYNLTTSGASFRLLTGFTGCRYLVWGV